MTVETEDRDPVTEWLIQANLCADIALALAQVLLIADMLEHGSISGKLARWWTRMLDGVRERRTWDVQRRWMLWQATAIVSGSLK